VAATVLIPCIWTGLEYFRGELYYLRFSWLNVGYAFSASPLLPAFHWLGMYGIGFAAMLAVVLISMFRPGRRKRKQRSIEDENEDDAERRTVRFRSKLGAAFGILLALVT